MLRNLLVVRHREESSAAHDASSFGQDAADQFPA